MTRADNFNFDYLDDFFLKASKKWKIVSFHDALHEKNPHLIIRHDVDFSPALALKFANWENSRNIRSTYFVQLSSKFYNFFDSTIIEIFRSILKLGHEIGLHFDPLVYGTGDKKNILSCMNREADFLKEQLLVPVKSVSFHNPSSLDNISEELMLGQYLNVYSDFFLKDYYYLSDSNGYWRDRSFETMLADDSIVKAHLLLHPLWWFYDDKTPRLKIHEVVFHRADQTMKDYDNLLEKSGRDNF